MPAHIFINYRKDDSRWNTQALYNELLKYFPKDSIFKDFNTIALGDDYLLSINKALEQCDVLLVIIGKNWLDIQTSKGAPRLQDPNDLVRIEIATAFKRNIKVIPVLFDNIEMFQETELPEDLQALTRRQYISINDIKFESDVQKLAEAIKEILANSKGYITSEKKSELKKPVSEKKTLPGKRWLISSMAGLIGALFSMTACYNIISNDGPRIQGGETIWEESLRGGIIAGLLWLIPGAICGPRKTFLQFAVIGAFLALGGWLVIARFAAGNEMSADKLITGVVFGMPMGAMLGILVAWLKQTTN